MPVEQNDRERAERTRQNNNDVRPIEVVIYGQNTTSIRAFGYTTLQLFDNMPWTQTNGPSE
eukprot:4165692-Prorocentrum_lima.AAC.1